MVKLTVVLSIDHVGHSVALVVRGLESPAHAAILQRPAVHVARGRLGGTQRVMHPKTLCKEEIPISFYNSC